MFEYGKTMELIFLLALILRFHSNKVVRGDSSLVLLIVQ